MGGSPMSKVFISYVRENRDAVQRLANDLIAGGLDVWLDLKDLDPGMRWKNEIHEAIKSGGFFLACFSPEYHARDSTHMNEELTLAVEESRRRHTDRPWFIPVLLEPCDIPNRSIGGGENLRDIQAVKLYEGWESGVQKLLKVMGITPAPPRANNLTNALSRRRRTILRAVVAAVCLGFAGVGLGIRDCKGKREVAVELRSWGLPENLGDYLGQLEKLDMGRPVTRLDWLSRASRLRSLVARVQLGTPTELPSDLKEFTCYSCSGLDRLVLPSSIDKLELINPASLPALPASLKTLNIQDRLSPIRIILSDLPRGLTSLSFRNPVGSILEDFPPGLRSLTIHGEAFLVGQLPLGLAELRLENYQFFPMKLLPQSVTSLSLGKARNPLSFNELPPNLDSLEIIYENDPLEDTQFLDLRGLPRRLTSLAIEDRRSPYADKYIMNESLDLREYQRLSNLKLHSIRFRQVWLPEGLRSLSMDTDLLAVAQLPSGLEQLTLVGGEVSDLEKLTRTLKSLRLEGVLIHEWKGLPSSLQSLFLSLDRVNAPMGVELPENLQSLQITDTQLVVRNMPPKLVTLIVDGEWGSLKGMLPSTLRSLDLSRVDVTRVKLEKLEDLGTLPPHLEELALPRTVNSLQGLPQSVRILRLN
jgi:hypothetical protein